jgi:hypothetical protein
VAVDIDDEMMTELSMQDEVDASADQEHRTMVLTETPNDSFYFLFQLV